MDIELATLKDIVEELHQRNLSFVFVGAENTNSERKSVICFAAQAGSADEAHALMQYGHETLADLDRGEQDWMDEN